MEKSITDIDQGKKLLSLGIDSKTADYHWYRQLCNWQGEKFKTPRPFVLSHEPWTKRGKMVQGFETFDEVPAWSISTLIGFLPARKWTLTMGGWDHTTGVFIPGDYFLTILRDLDSEEPIVTHAPGLLDAVVLALEELFPPQTT